MAWPVTDFDGVLFNDGTGGAEVAAIYTAIRQRAQAVNHALASTTYADAWPGTPVWLGSSVGGSAGDGRTYLKDVLEDFYGDVVTLATKTGSFPNDSGFTTASGGDTFWTGPTLVADIGMGEFTDLLTKPANPEPFIWLHEALDRLIYYRAVMQAEVGSATSVRKTTPAATYTTFAGEFEDAWDDLQSGGGLLVGVTGSVGWVGNAVGGVPFGGGGYWDDDANRYIQFQIRSQYNGVTFPVDDYGGARVSAQYLVEVDDTGLRYTGGDLAIEISSESFSPTSATTALATTAPTPGAELSVNIAITSTEPPDAPFDDTNILGGLNWQEGWGFQINHLRLYLNITSELTDQA